MQGATGCGKSLIGEALRVCFGLTNSRMVLAEQLLEKFNPWGANCLFAYFEEVLVGERQKDTMEKLKNLVTGTTINIRRMRTDAVEYINMLNGLFISNHLHGLRLDREDRRFFCLICALKCRKLLEEMKKDGYFVQLARLKTDLAGGLRHYLLTVPFHPEFNPLGHAPINVDRDTILRSGASDTDATIAGIIESEDSPMVCSDVLSFGELYPLVAAELRFVSRQQIARVLSEMGFVRLERQRVGGDRHVLWYNPERMNGSDPADIFAVRSSYRDMF